MFANSLKLVRFIVRRDRMSLPIWLVSMILFTVAMPILFDGMYQSAEERQAMVATMENPAIIAMLGPGYGFDNYTIGAMTGNYMLLWMVMVVAMMNIFFVARHTRTDEENGRLELVRSLPVGRLSALGSTLIVAIMFNAILALLTGFGLYATGVDSVDLQGSLLFGVAMGVIGMLFSAITALFAQLSSTSRGTIGYSFAFLIAAYIVRASGDISNEALARISPLGLILRTEVYVNNDWWPVWIVLIEALIIGILAFYLNAIRDLGASFIPAKTGRKTASIFLQSTFGLSWRLLRNTVISWAVGIFILGASYGSILGDLEGFLSSNELFQAAFDTSNGVSLTDQFVPFLMTIMTIISSIPVIACVLKIRGEEKHGLMEHLLVRSVSRYQIMASYTLIAFACSIVFNFLTAIGFWSVGRIVMDDPISLATFIKASMVYVPALWVMIGIALMFIGFLPSFTSVVWVYLGYSFFAVYLGRMIQLPEWTASLAPYGHIPQLPIDEMNWINVTILTSITLLMAIAGFIGYGQRDIQD